MINKKWLIVKLNSSMKSKTKFRLQRILEKNGILKQDPK